MRNTKTNKQLSFLDEKYTVRTEDNMVYLQETTGWYVIWVSYYNTMCHEVLIHAIEEKFRQVAQQMSWHIIGADEGFKQICAEFPNVKFGHDIRPRHLLNKGQ